MMYPDFEEYDDGGYDDTQERYGDTRLGPWDNDPNRDAWTGEWINPDEEEPTYHATMLYPTDPDAGEPPF